MAGRAMTLAPLVGLVFTVIVVGPLGLLRGMDWLATVIDSPLLTSALALGVLALLTRGMHLDGLADVADGLGSGRRGPEAVAIMRKSDIGPFGVVTLLVTLLLQVTALAELFSHGAGLAGLLIALVLSRAVLPFLCLPAFPAASESGLGRTMAGSVSARQAALALVLAAGLILGGVALLELAGLAPDFARLAFGLLGLVPALLLALRCRTRFGGVTGDVYGAAVETAYTGILVATALAF